jgi:hypothetical protein
MRHPAHLIPWLLACLLLAACGAQQEPVTEADKAILVRVGDLAAFNVRLPDAESGESFSKVRQLDGAYELTYKFETPSGAPRPLFIHVSATLGRKASDAVLAESAEKIGLLIALKKSGVLEQEVAGIKSGRLALLVKDGQPIGNLFTMREGSKTYLFLMSGLFVRDAESWEKLAGKRIEQLVRYEIKT